MSPNPIEESRAELVALSTRIRQHDDESAAIDRARTARLTMDEIAADVGINRATLYNTLKRAAAHTTKGRPGPLRTHAPEN